ncbi:flagellar basal body P-ring protein FlgI [Pseudomonadales bacterium]|nr:flagellar basal body P-ring protein FlgI [Gammaproteobacteria bacterium]MDA7726443.1 flagellar basal body P-ring protein FlgI [Pseudomonadales bacterium]MDC1017007.1 flagellar basal body P-ring protein FlgI [Pseudomonadales bacterium]MDC1479914.1 flagellar basal body P-ring protein FlgI [Pseudomonadales bacterium]
MNIRSLLCIFALIFTQEAAADRIKDLTSVAGVRSNQLIGYGLVVGLGGTGDRDKISFTAQSLKTTLDRLGVDVDGPISNYDLYQRGVASLAYDKTKLDNVASVIVTATLPPFAKPGQVIDVNVAAIGLASSLRGGNLILTELRGADGEIYGLAQGSLTVSGLEVSAAGSEITVGVPTAGRIPGGAIIEREVETAFGDDEYLVLYCNQNDFTTATAISDVINEQFGDGTATAVDGTSIAVMAPETLGARVSFLSLVENLEVIPGEPKARVVVNSRTGTVVINRTVRVTAAAVTHGQLSVTVSATNEVSQPPAGLLGGGEGETVPIQNAEITVAEEARPMFVFQPGVNLRDIVDAVNQVGATPSSLIAILDALKSSGSLRAELIVL